MSDEGESKQIVLEQQLAECRLRPVGELFAQMFFAAEIELAN